VIVKQKKKKALLITTVDGQADGTAGVGLDLSWCHSLTALPESMGSLTGLQKLDLFRCSGLTALSEWMVRVTGLQQQRLHLSSGPG
jgi:hypothetical protein